MVTNISVLEHTCAVVKTSSVLTNLDYFRLDHTCAVVRGRYRRYCMRTIYLVLERKCIVDRD